MRAARRPRKASVDVRAPKVLKEDTMRSSFGDHARRGSRVGLLVPWLILVVSAGTAPRTTAQEGLLGASASKSTTAEGRIDAEADRLLREMCDYLGSLPTFTVKARNTMEVVVLNGQKLNFEAASEVAVARPNRVRSRRAGVLDELDFYYDGSQMTLYVQDGDMGFYGSREMPDDLDAALDVLRDSLSLEVPGADLLYSDAYDGMMWDVYEATYVGLESVGGGSAHHLAFRASAVDFEVWVLDGDRPLPAKYVITEKWTTGAPQFAVELSDWDVTPTIDPDLFTFTPPPGAMRIDFLEGPWF